MTNPDTPADFDPAQLTFVTRGVSEPEAAAVTAVLRALLRAESDELRASPHGARSPWQESQRAVRAPLAPGEGRWRGFRA